MIKKFAISFLILTLLGCSSANGDSEISYEEVYKSIKKISKDHNPLLDYISISNVDNYELSKIDELEYRLSFRFTIENITDNELSLEYIGYVPEQLKSYFLARETFEAYDVTLKPGQKMDSSFGVLVLNPNKLGETAREFLDEYGERLYMHFIINGENYYYELIIK